MNEERVANALGWFSVGLGVAEVVAGKTLAQSLGMEHRTRLVQTFGVREIVTGAGILSQQRPTAWVWGRVAGDALDLAALGRAYSPHNPQRDDVAAAIGTVVGVTLADLWCAWQLSTRTYLKTGQYPHQVSQHEAKSVQYAPGA